MAWCQECEKLHRSSFVPVRVERQEAMVSVARSRPQRQAVSRRFQFQQDPVQAPILHLHHIRHQVRPCHPSHLGTHHQLPLRIQHLSAVHHRVPLHRHLV